MHRHLPLHLEPYPAEAKRRIYAKAVGIKKEFASYSKKRNGKVHEKHPLLKARTLPLNLDEFYDELRAQKSIGTPNRRTYGAEQVKRKFMNKQKSNVQQQHRVNDNRRSTVENQRTSDPRNAEHSGSTSENVGLNKIENGGINKFDNPADTMIIHYENAIPISIIQRSHIEHDNSIIEFKSAKEELDNCSDKSIPPCQRNI